MAKGCVLQKQSSSIILENYTHVIDAIPLIKPHPAGSSRAGLLLLLAHPNRFKLIPHYIKGYFTSRLFSCHFSSLLCTFLDCIFMPLFSACQSSSDQQISSWKIFISSFTQRKWQRSFNSWSDLIIQGEKRTPWAPRFGLFIESKSRHLWPLQWNYLLSNEQEIDSVDHEQCPPLIIGVLWMKKKASLGYYCRGCPLQEMPSSRVGTLIY